MLGHLTFDGASASAETVTLSSAEYALYGAVVTAVLATGVLTYAVVRPAGSRVGQRAVGVAVGALLAVVLILCVAVVGLQGWDLAHLWHDRR